MSKTKLNNFKVFTITKLLKDGKITEQDFLTKFETILEDVEEINVDYIKKMSISNKLLNVVYLDDTQVTYELNYNTDLLTTIKDYIGEINERESQLQNVSTQVGEVHEVLNIAKILKLKDYDLSNDEIKVINSHMTFLQEKTSSSLLNVTCYLLAHLKALYNSKGEYLDTIGYLKIIADMNKQELLETFQNSLLYKLSTDKKELYTSGILNNQYTFEKGKNSTVDYNNLSFTNWVDYESNLNVSITRPIIIGGNVYAIKSSFVVDVFNKDIITINPLKEFITLTHNDRINYLYRNEDNEYLYKKLATALTTESLLMTDEQFKELQTSIEEELVEYFNEHQVFTDFLSAYNEKLHASIEKGWLHRENKYTNTLLLDVKNGVEILKVQQFSKSINIITLDEGEGYLMELDGIDKVLHIVYTDLDKLIDALLFIGNIILFGYSSNTLVNFLLEIMELESMKNYKDGDTFVNIPLNLNNIPITDNITLYSYLTDTTNLMNIEVEDEVSLDTIYNVTFSLNDYEEYIPVLKELI